MVTESTKMYLTILTLIKPLRVEFQTFSHNKCILLKRNVVVKICYIPAVVGVVGVVVGRGVVGNAERKNKRIQVLFVIIFTAMRTNK